MESDDLSRVGPQPLLLCNCCSRDTESALFRSPVKFGSGRHFPLRVPCAWCVCVISWGPTCTNCWIPAPPHSPSKDPGPCAFCTFPGGHRPRSCPGDTWLSPWGTSACSREWDRPHLPVPMTTVLNWVLSYLHIWLLRDHSWGQVWGSPLSLSSPQARPCASLLLWKAWAPKVLYVFIVTLY